jgi:1-acyl-sn-glycerol-3-phosphate acyltransferase
MGTQSAFFGPVKYSLLPEHLRDEELLGGNALVELGTFGAILGGTILGGTLLLLPQGRVLAALGLLLIAAAGLFAAREVPSAPPRSTGKVDWNLLRSTSQTVGLGMSEAGTRRPILLASWFWFLGALLLGALPSIALGVLAGPPRLVTTLLAVFALGVGLGSVAAEWVARTSLKPLAALVAGGALLVSLLHLALGLGSEGVSQARVLGDLFAVGATGGAFVVPLYAEMQRRSGVHVRSQIIASNNILNALFMVAAAGMAAWLAARDVPLSQVLLVATALHLGPLLAMVYWQRLELLQGVARVGLRLCYRLDIRGMRSLPEEGAGLVVANHVSYTDAILLGAFAPRPMRFVMDHRVFRTPVLGYFFRLTRAIPIAPASEDARVKEQAFEAIHEALAAGELVCLFPEGKLTRDGQADRFRPGVERILERDPVPVYPVGLTGLWGSSFSYAHGRPGARFPARLRAAVSVRAGDAVPTQGKPESGAARPPSAAQLERCVAELCA